MIHRKLAGGESDVEAQPLGGIAVAAAPPHRDTSSVAWRALRQHLNDIPPPPEPGFVLASAYVVLHASIVVSSTIAGGCMFAYSIEVMEQGYASRSVAVVMFTALYVAAMCVLTLMFATPIGRFYVRSALVAARHYVAWKAALGSAAVVAWVLGLAYAVLMREISIFY